MTSKHKTSKRQFGFFDLGFSLMILAITGGIAVTVDHVEDRKIAARQERAAIAATESTPSIEAASVALPEAAAELQ